MDFLVCPPMGNYPTGKPGMILRETPLSVSNSLPEFWVFFLWFMRRGKWQLAMSIGSWNRLLNVDCKREAITNR